jgi:hypothetical protein
LEATSKTEMKTLTDFDVFNRSSDSEWAAPTFLQAKKTGDVRILTYFRRLNAQIRRKPFPFPKTSDLLRKLSGFKYDREKQNAELANFWILRYEPPKSIAWNIA